MFDHQPFGVGVFDCCRAVRAAAKHPVVNCHEQTSFFRSVNLHQITHLESHPESAM